MLIRIGIAAKLLGVSTKTLRRWDKDGKLRATMRTLGGHRRYETTDFTFLDKEGTGENQKEEGQCKLERVVGYVRVSSAKQKADLERQQRQVVHYAETRGWDLEMIYKDIASGLNDRRSGLKRLIRDCSIGHIERVLITYDDRLSRFGNHLLEWLLNSWEVTLERISPVNLADGPEKQLFEDILAVMTSFTGKFHRLRRGKGQSVLAPSVGH